MEGVFLYDIDSLQSIAEQSLTLRRQQVAAAEQIIAEHVADFGSWLKRGLGESRARTAAIPHTPISDAPLRASES
jgi:glutamyl-tRNA reductase